MTGGYRNPPAATRFVKGQSGNPRGRPPGRKSQSPYEAVLGQKVQVRDGNTTRRLTAAEAFLLQLTRKGLEGDAQAARVAMAAIEDAQARFAISRPEPITVITMVLVAPGSVTPALIPLKMARKLDPYRETVRIRLEPWLVEAALDRLGARRLTIDEQREVYRATRTPAKVNWPLWWQVF